MIGAGYVGLVTGTCLADFGHNVTCVDRDADRIAALQAGAIPIFEPGLEELVANNAAAGRLAFAAELSAPVAAAEAVLIAVGTPARHGDGYADLTHVYTAAREIAAALDGYTVVIIKSTVPVGTGDEVERIIRQARPDADVSVVSNPEFLREGAAIVDFKRPDRIIAGVEDNRARAVVEALYRPLYLNQAPLLFVSRRTAELTKYAANAFLATKISFINEIADLCEKTGANVQDVARGIGMDNRIGPKFLNAGPGYGGSCFPKDIKALIKTAHDLKSPLRIVEAVASVNDERKRAIARKVIAACGGDVRGKTIGLLGLTFKPNTDDMREAPSLAIAATLRNGGARLRVHDPAGMEQAKALMGDGVEFVDSPYAAAEGADALALVTEWDAYRALDLARVAASMCAPVLVDLRNVYRTEEVESYGFAYYCVGRPMPKKSSV
jgi:UDPglucose 6-dehydrogenase